MPTHRLYPVSADTIYGIKLICAVPSLRTDWRGAEALKVLSDTVTSGSTWHKCVQALKRGSGYVLAAFDAVWNADAGVGIAGQIQAR